MDFYEYDDPDNYSSDDETFDLYADLDENKNVMVCIPSTYSDDVAYHVLKLEDVNFFRELARNMDTPNYKSTLISGMFIYVYDSGIFKFKIMYDGYETYDGTANVKLIRKLAEDVAKKFDSR